MLTSVVLAVLAAVSPIQDVFTCGKPGAAGGLADGADMVRYTIDTQRYPNALCNDGTPAVFYFAPSTAVEDRDKWFIYLQGGGSCGSGQSCAERWCSFDTNFGMDKMTTSLTKPSIRASGFLRPVPQNEFGTWNRVLVFYCSSDMWSGTRTATETATIGGVTREYAIQFQGSNIVDAVLDTLRNEGNDGGKGRRRAVAYESAPWPDLDAATEVLFAGSSGGGNGIRNNADRVGARLRATNPGLADYRVLIDAIGMIRMSDLDFGPTTMCRENPVNCTYEGYMRTSWEQTDRALYAARGDESCLTWHAANAPGTEWLCNDNEHVVKHHITTPFFLRVDLQDQLIAGNIVDVGLTTYTQYGTKLESEMRNLPLPEEPQAAAPGLFVPQCKHHESITSAEAVFEVFVDGSNFHDLVWNWWRGAMPRQAIARFAGEGIAPGCPNE